MSDVECPRCHTTKYKNPSLKLLVNICGHSLCDSCVEILFVRGSGKCCHSGCGIPLKRTNFRVQVFEDNEVEKDVDIRKKILKDFNKNEQDFDTLREYNNYLEEVETIIFNLTYDIDVVETKQKIEEYKFTNQEIIKRNRLKMSNDEIFLNSLIDEEKMQSEILKKELILEAAEDLKLKNKRKDNLIDDLMFSEKGAKEIVENYKQEIQEKNLQTLSIDKKNTFSTGLLIGHTETTAVPLVVTNSENIKDYEYVKPIMDIKGPDFIQDLSTNKHLRHIRHSSSAEVAGGFITEIACHRALQEAFCGLYFTKF